MSTGHSSPDGGSHQHLPTPWADAPEKVLDILNTTIAQGLSDPEANRRLRQYGRNRLRHMQRRNAWRILLDQFASLIVLLLVAAAAVAFAFDEIIEGFAIGVVILINATIGFVTERRALRSMDALRELGHTETNVRRNGNVCSLAAELLVPGDIVVLDAGDVLSADVRLISGSRLQMDESPLTGESLPIDKDSPGVSADSVLAERSSMLYKGTAVTRGSGEGVVVATGMATELGHISALVEDAEPGNTPLEKRLDRLARKLIGLTLVIAVVVVGIVVAAGKGLYFAVEIGIALAVATIPEGLPIVATVALARGMWRMARRNALVERLASVETLGSTTVILTDKTGTLTENRMTVVEICLGRGRIQVDGTGLESRGRFSIDNETVNAPDQIDLIEALRIAVLCNNATFNPATEGQDVQATGDPTEVALLVVGAKAGLDQEVLREEWPETGEIAFDPDTKRMATLHRAENTLVAAVKGAPETVVNCCTSVRVGDEVKPLDDKERSDWLELATEMAARGERVLTLATGRAASVAEFRFEDLTLLGHAGFFDPPRESVRAAIDSCQDAGIRLVMVTGDHGATAWTVASAVGLIDPEPDAPISFLDGRNLGALEDLSDSDTQAILNAPLIARVSPQQKLDILALHQQHGAVVAMTGDGVNDAPALKKADIGVAMGMRGTQVAREAADIVLLDDELGSIVTAIAHGRAIFANIRKFVVYLMTCNVSEIFAVALGVFLQGPMPILPLQILFLNLVTDVFPALALGVGEGSPALIRQPPRDPQESVLARQHWRLIFFLGIVMALSVIGALLIATTVLSLPAQQATTVAFLTLAMAQLWHVFSMRDRSSRWLRNEITLNPWIWAALALCMVLLVCAVFLPPLASVLSLANPGPAGWSVALLSSIVPLIVGQLLLLPIMQK